LLPEKKKKAKGHSQAAQSMSPSQRIEAAIELGVPIFNQGDHEKCADIYSQCLTELTKDQAIDSSVRKALVQLVARVDDREATERAWLLRAALDRVYESVTR